MRDRHRKTLTYKETRNSRLSKLWSHGSYKSKVLVNEPGLYELISHSKLPEAEEFQDWVYEEVLPSIRKHGIYATETTIDNLLANPDNAIKVFTELKNEREARKQAELQIKEEKEDVQFAKAIGDSKEKLIYLMNKSNALVNPRIFLCYNLLEVILCD